MSTEVTLPELGENIASGDLVKLLVKPGDHVEKDQPIIELETDKATIEVPSPSSGTVSQVHVKEGQKLQVGQAILSLDGDSGNGAGRKQAEAPKVERPRRDGARSPESTVMSKSAEPAQQAEQKPKPAKSQLPEAKAPPAKPATGGKQQVTLPELGENITSGDLVKILVKVGDRVEENQPLIELETDKATVEVPSPASGTVAEILVKQGQKLNVGQPIVTLSGASAAPAAKAEPEQPRAPQQTVMTKSAEPAQQAEEPPQKQAAVPERGPAPAQAAAPTPTPSAPGKRSPADVPAAPSVRQLAREIGVDITDVQGTGPGGRISFDDVKRHARERRPAAAAVGIAPQVPLPDFSKWGPIERQAMNAVRRATARQMAYAWTIPSVTQNDKADITSLEQLRKHYAARAEQAGGKLTTTAIALKIVAGALKVFPKFAASIDLGTEETIYKKYVHIGVAVDTERGLVVPVIRDVDKKNILQLSVELAQAAQKARDRKLSPEDLEGGVFTITNLGGIGGTFFSPIINAPQVAILGLARAQYEPVFRPAAPPPIPAENPDAPAVQGHFEPRLMLPLSLTYDHRIIDGADAARFLRWLAEAFEQPFVLSLEG